MLGHLVKVKKIKGKQNKKKWRKNIDMSDLLEHIENENNEKRKKDYTPKLVVEDDTQKKIGQLNPDRFKNRPKSQPKPKFDNSYKPVEIIDKNMEDPWGEDIIPPKKRKTQKLQVPSIVKPPTAHSYNAKQEHMEEIYDQIIQYEKPKEKKEKKIKKYIDKKIVPRARNKRVRQQYLLARERKMKRQLLHQENSYKKIEKQINEQNKAIEETIERKQKKKNQIQQDKLSGKVREGPKLGKLRYQYREYIPEQSQLGKKVSQISGSEVLMRDRYDSIFRRGIMEPRNIKVHANKKKNIKVKEYYRD